MLVWGMRVWESLCFVELGLQVRHPGCRWGCCSSPGAEGSEKDREESPVNPRCLALPWGVVSEGPPTTLPPSSVSLMTFPSGTQGGSETRRSRCVLGVGRRK